MTDDGYVSVPLNFPFPFYGQVFTRSWMYDNGVIGFMDPTTGFDGGRDYYSQPLGANLVPRFYYMIAALWTDLVPVTGVSSYQSQGTTEYQRYYWNNIGQWGSTQNLNTFSVEIQPSGLISTNYSLLNIQYSGYPTSVGIVGDASQGEYTQLYYSNGANINTGTISNWDTTTNALPPDPCTLDPQSSNQCPGYVDPICLSNPLSDPGCPGYQSAFLEMCIADPLYSEFCPGYDDAYFTQQCSADPLYDSGCTGYAQAYYDQQCSINSLYDSGCTGYAEAYQAQQISQLCLASPTNPLCVAGSATVVMISDSGSTTSADSAATAEPQINTDGTVSMDTPLVSDPIVNSVLTATTSPSSNDNTVDTVSPAAIPAPVTASPRQQQQQQQQAQQTQRAVSQMERRSGGREDAQRTARSRAQNLARDMSSAASMEDQTAAQDLLLGLMNYNASFSDYQSAVIPDASFYSLEEAYKNNSMSDNRRAHRQLNQASDILHQRMIDQQYRR
jgi:hypothetical protein